VAPQRFPELLGSHQAQVIIEHLQCAEFELRRAVNVKYTLGFPDSVKKIKKECKISH
jgi:hypothetical protein